MCALREWRHYLLGEKFVVETDHNSLRYIQTQPSLSNRQARWLEKLAEFDYDVKYLKGAENVVADALSREAVVAAVSTVKVDSLLEKIKGKYENAEDKPKDVEVGTDGVWRRNGKVYVPNNQEIKQMVMNECHDGKLAGHVGKDKTIELVCRQFYWPRMHAEIADYVSSCLPCQSNKPSNQLPSGLLQPLPVPEKKGQVWSIDYIMGLPKTKSGNDGIQVMVEKLTKLVKFAPIKTTITAPQSAAVFFDKIVCSHGVPESIVSDRDARFTSSFWRCLWKLLGTKLSMSTAYHPQTDGQTERANRTLEDMLRAFVDYRQRDWDEYLGSAEIACNNSVQLSTGFSPFYLTYGYHPSFPISAAIRTEEKNSNNETANQYIENIHAAIEKAKENLLAAQQRQKKYADEDRREVEFAEGDQVLLSTANLNNELRAPKLMPRFIGPFRIKRKVGSVAYELSLPAQLSRIHPVFHVSKLKKYNDGDARFTERKYIDRPLPELLDNGEEAWEVKQIVDKRVRAGRTQYLVLWKGYPDYEKTWEPISSLKYARDAVREYEQSVQH